MGKGPSFVSIVRRCRDVAVMTTCSVIPRARMIGAPKTKNVCQSLGLATIIAKTVRTIERPIKRPATKRPACRNLPRGFFMIHSDPECDGWKPKVVNPLALTAKQSRPTACGSGTAQAAHTCHIGLTRVLDATGA